MRYAQTFLFLLILSQGCKDHESSSTSSKGSSNFEIKISALVAEKGKLTFNDSSRSSTSALENGKACALIFQRDAKVEFSSVAYNICKFHGTFTEINGDILIVLDMEKSEGGLAFLDGRIDPVLIHFPPLRLQDTSEGLVLIRKDRRVDLKEHWNIYPDAKENIFPFCIADKPNKKGQRR